jgi:hypothetical protein
MADKRLLLSAAVVDTEQVTGTSQICFVWPQKTEGGYKVRKAYAPIVAFTLDQVEDAKSFLDKLIQVSNFPTAINDPVVAISDQNILLVEKAKTQKEVQEKREAAGLKSGDTV